MTTALIKHPLCSWPTLALISPFDVFSFLNVSARGEIKEDTETNSRWDLKSFFMDSVDPIFLGYW